MVALDNNNDASANMSDLSTSSVTLFEHPSTSCSDDSSHYPVDTTEVGLKVSSIC